MMNRGREWPGPPTGGGQFADRPISRSHRPRRYPPTGPMNVAAITIGGRGRAPGEFRHPAGIATDGTELLVAGL